MTRLHINALILAVMLFLLQLAIFGMPGQELSQGYIPLLGEMIRGNGDREISAYEGILIPLMFSPMAGLIYTMKWFAGIRPGSKEDDE